MRDGTLPSHGSGQRRGCARRCSRPALPLEWTIMGIVRGPREGDRDADPTRVYRGGAPAGCVGGMGHRTAGR
jgi:hypothetical protein